MNYWEQIVNTRSVKDYVKWILCDKYIAKQFAEQLGFKIPKTYQLVKNASDINFKELHKITTQYVIKPTDYCDSYGVFLIKDNINLINNKTVSDDYIVSYLEDIRQKTKHQYYMHELMYNFKIPFKGYIVEELLLDKDTLPPCDYKCYVFGGKLFLIAKTFNRKQTINENTNDMEQSFNSVWMTRSWKPIPFKMIKKNYKYTTLQKPPEFDKMVRLVENASRILQRHCRIDVYLLNGEVYLGEFTFFCGAFLHTKICNVMLGMKWKLNPDTIDIQNENNKKLIKILNTLTPSNYTQLYTII